MNSERFSPSSRSTGIDARNGQKARFLSWHETWAPGIVARVVKRPRTLLTIYAFVAAWAIYTGPKIFEKCSTDSSAPTDSPSDKAGKKLQEYFPEDATSVSALIYIESTSSKNFKNESNAALREITAKTQIHFEQASSAAPYGCVVQSYTTFMNQNLASFAEEMISEDGARAIISVVHSPGNVDGEKLGNELIKFVDDLKGHPCCSDLWIGVSGTPVIDAESNLAALEDLANADIITIPLAMCVLAYMLSSPRLLAITLVNFITSLSLAYSVVYYIASAGLSTSSATPGIMQSVLMAVSVDYSLFMLTRFVEELKSGQKYQKAVEEALMSAGHTVLGSGSTLMLAFMALCFFPIALFVSLALGVVFAIFFAIFVNLTLTPIMLLCFPGFFGNLDHCCRCFSSLRNMSVDAIDDPHERKVPRSEDMSSESVEDLQDDKVPVWYRIAQCTTRPTITVVVCVTIVLISIVLFPLCTGIEQSADVSQEVPRGSDAMTALWKVENTFGGGVANPYSILIVPKVEGSQDSGSIFTVEFWTTAKDVLNRIPPHFKSSGRNSILSPMYQLGAQSENPLQAGLDTRLQLELWRQCHESFDGAVPDGWQLPNPWPCTPGPNCCMKTFGNEITKQQFQLQSDEEAIQMASMMSAILQQTTNTAGSAVRAQVMADFPLGSRGGIDFTKGVRQSLDQSWQRAEVWLAEGDSKDADMLDAIAEWSGIICGATMAVILVLVGILYRSIVIPLRGIITILVTQIVGFAILTAVYCRGYFSDLGIDAFKGIGGVNFLVPPMTFVIVLGLSLDYDVFLIGRIVEYRKRGFSDNDAIELGVWKTSKIITAAGVIMMIAFSGQLFSRMYLMNELGCVLVTAVALDTLFLRAVATPAMMAPLGSWNWWPSKMPLATRDAMAYVVKEDAISRQTVSLPSVEDSPPKPSDSSTDTGGDSEAGDEMA